MTVYQFSESPTPASEYDFPRYKGFTFKDCKRKADYHPCSGKFTTRQGETVFCDCDCHYEPREDD
jgi:hypothetical protein